MAVVNAVDSAAILSFPRPVPAQRSGWRRSAGLAAGLGVHAVFAVTVVSLFEFLRYGTTTTDRPWLLADLILAVQFAVPHSLLLHPRVRSRLQRWIRPEFYGLFYCLCTCASLQLLFHFWRASPTTLWDAAGPAESVVLAGFYASWTMLFYSLHLGGLGYQTGLTPWLFWWRGEPLPRRSFVPRSLYRWFRHPVYLSFLGLIWFTPVMSADHVLLTTVWTVYLFIGSWLKDQRLQHFLGQSYRDYRENVPAYPLPIRILKAGSRRAA